MSNTRSRPKTSRPSGAGKSAPAPSGTIEVVPTVLLGDSYFSSVKKARAALKERAFSTYEKLLKIIDIAAASGDFETAAKYTWMLIEHTAPEEGETVIAGSAAKPIALDSGPKGPVIQIGVKIGGTDHVAKQLPEIITVDIEQNDPAE